MPVGACHFCLESIDCGRDAWFPRTCPGLAMTRMQFYHYAFVVVFLARLFVSTLASINEAVSDEAEEKLKHAKYEGDFETSGLAIYT